VTNNAIVVASKNGDVGMMDAIDVLRTGGSAIDAVVAGISRVEANPDDHSVGFSGLPNLLGTVELDASIMDGLTRATGAVGAVQDYQDVILLARRVMELLPHSFLVGDGAQRFAAEIGMQRTTLLTSEAEQIWDRRLGDRSATDGDPFMSRIRELVASTARDPELPDVHGTVNVIARDRNGNIASGVSTSGWAWKYPGRLGDSPVIGAGNYADNRWGAAACTGRGEMSLRCCTAHSVVTSMRFGSDLRQALVAAMDDLVSLDDSFASEINIVAIDRIGNHGGASTTEGKTYVFIDETMSSPEERTRLWVPFG
jgi:beta-aspartyl-peptidase (threonine type)